MTPVPEAFVEYARSSRYLDLIGPIFEHRDDASIVGLVVDDRLILTSTGILATARPS